MHYLSFMVHGAISIQYDVTWNNLDVGSNNKAIITKQISWFRSILQVLDFCF